MKSMKILSINQGQKRKVYDLQTRNHNFVANDCTVHNCLIFQEDVMNLTNKVSGFPLDQTDEVRRAIMKRSISGGEAARKKTQELEDSIVKGAEKNGVPHDIAKKMYETICYMSGYGFNRCVTCDTEVDTYAIDGLTFVKCVKHIKDVKSGEFVLSYNETTKQLQLVTVKQTHFNGTKEVVEVTLKSGEVIRCTLDHKFRVQENRQMLPLSVILENDFTIVRT